MQTGLYFGSFNPIHIGHLIIAQQVLNNTNVDKVWFIVSPQNPLKPSHSLLNEYSRLHLVKIATEDNNRLWADDVEFRLPKPSYTIDTLTYLQEKHPLREFAVIIGSDSFQNLHKWKNYEELIKKYALIVYRRPGFDINSNDAKLNKASINVLDAPLLEISSTKIRELIAQGKSPKYFLPDKVFEEIEKSSYYKPKSH